MRKKILLLLSVFVAFLAFGSVPCLAAEYEPWEEDSNSFYSYGFNLAALPKSYYTENINAADTLMTRDSNGSIVRTIDGVTYSASTAVYKPSSSLLYPTDLYINEIGPSFFSSGSYLPSSFTDLDIIFCINVYGSVATLSDFEPYCSAMFYNLSYESGSGVAEDVRLIYTPIASVKYSNASVTFIFRLSYHGDRFFINNYPPSVNTGVPNSFLGFIWGTSPDNDPRVPFVDSLIDIDVGVVACRIGDRTPISYEDLWGDLPYMPQVQYPPPSSGFKIVFDEIFKSHFVLVYIVPVMSTLIGFFTLRIILWKEV